MADAMLIIIVVGNQSAVRDDDVVERVVAFEQQRIEAKEAAGFGGSPIQNTFV